MSATAAAIFGESDARPDADAGTAVSSVAWAGVVMLALVAPFELLEPVVRLPWQSISTVELALLVAGGAWMAAAIWRRDARWVRAPMVAPWSALLVAMTLSAVFAPESRVNALHMVGRFGMAFGVYLMTLSAVTTPARACGLMVAASLSGFVVATLAILEYMGFGAVAGALRAFRPGLAVVGGQIRASGPLQYPTIASMYLEIIFAFVLGLLVAACGRRRWAFAAGWFLGAVVVAEAIVLTFTRAGLITMAFSLLFVAEGQRRRRGIDDMAVLAIVGLAAVVGALMVSGHSLESMRLRLTTETEAAWYRARVAAPARLMLATGAFAAIPVTLTNTGRAVWDSGGDPPFRLSYHWLLADEDRVVSYDGLRTTFGEPVSPGQTVSLQARVRAPMRPGEYRLMWDLVEERRLWFSTEPEARFSFSRVVVSGPAVGPSGAVQLTRLPRSASRPGRLVLWTAAARMLAAHPFLGVGPDNYRLSYGAWAGVPDADQRVHSNDLYFEMLVGGGLIGGLAFVWLLWSALGSFRAALRAQPLGESAVLGVGAAGLAIVVHGTVDTFLGFTPTYTLIALTVGLAAACGARTERGSDANRV